MMTTGRFGSTARTACFLGAALCTSASAGSSPRRPVGARASQQVAAPELRAGGTVERAIKNGETQTFSVRLAAGQFLNVTVRQFNFDVSLLLTGPTQDVVADRQDADGASLWPEALSIVAAVSGLYTLQVRAVTTNTLPDGRYALAINALRAATPHDKVHVAAEAAYSSGNELRSKDDAASVRSAVDQYRASSELWRSIDAPDWEAETLLRLGDAQIHLNEYPAATATVEQARTLWTKLGDAAGEAHALNKLGVISFNTGKPAEALEYFRQSADLATTAGDRARAASMLNNVGYIYSTMGESKKALEYLERALAEMTTIGDVEGLFSTINNIAGVYAATGAYQKALDSYRDALDVSRRSGVRSSEATALNNLGSVYSNLGKTEESLDYHSRSLALMRDLGDQRGQATALTNIGSLYIGLRQPDKALDAYKQALTLRQATSDRSGEAATLYNMGNLLNEPLHDYPAALDHLGRARTILHELGERQGEAITLGTMAKVLFRLKEPDKSRANFLESLQISRDISDHRSQSITLHLLATVAREQGDLTGARGYIEESLGIKEALRRSVAVADLRASYFATVQDSYELYVDLLLRLHRQDASAGYDRVALEAAERARARRLLDTAAAGGADIRQGVETALLDREREVQRTLAAAAQKQSTVLARAHTEADAAAAKKDVDGLLGQLEEAEASIKRQSPNYAALVQPGPLTTSAMQAELGRDDLLLEFALGSDKSVLWAVTPTGVSTFDLPKRSEVETLSRRWYEELSARNQHPPDERADQWQTRVAAAEQALRQTAAALSQMLLGPAKALLGGKRLLIAPVGGLQSVAFGALPAPDAARDDPTPLIARHEVVVLPSVSTISLQRQNRPRREGRVKTVAVFADPVFDADDPRVRRGTPPGVGQATAGARSSDTTEAAALGADVDRAADAAGLSVRGGRLPRLRFSRDEALAILSLVPPAARSQALDFDANVTAATSPALSAFRIVHIASHAFLNGDHPELSGIALSTVDARGAPMNGFLRLHQIYTMRIPADLVVLSACQTALGREIGGEGLVGLTRAFMYAGAASVVASLWKVDDQATAELMKLFYQNMLGPRHLRPAAALRAAQTTMSQNPRWRSPYYWAAFVLGGEWR